ncbi:MAG: hypothetical protein A2Y00_10745 [Omnitrophica WOR_2 bacterium GWF2_43_52]|nr:MAG: hypothetical protein A2062_04865 [Omnitrophica WOR_2 bacterium GWA2_44_7]OGX16154.1 MAG: hypothetical protein A2Y01_05595 [Omnitrophica WOR_2 bacterium GWC2_44_8]OGX20770.1 MAG: hypothetical protein A2Y00_10745 [Omnitrophica WOR_2 bacterium GWF2_43_52]OGX54915.1 MAG: hypothetical protein A2460_02720 [Omnitrophica WOR_2 bacterium RIFOXYC2_FULL_43_9]HAH19794.1 hypothetical protein [Candidatus Omnitrophota bacterium]
MLKKTIAVFLSFNFLFTQCLFAQGVAQLNIGSYLRTATSSMAVDKFRPVHMRYFSYDIATDKFEMLLDKGDNKDIKEDELKDKSKALMEYFQIGLSLPNDKFWVNLRPDAEDQIIDPELEKTDVGKIMLEADLQLKKDTASFTSPQTPEGKEYWDKLYKKAGELFGTENITIPTITRPWIVPGEIIIREGEDSGSTSLTTSAYIYKANMKVMLEQDHLQGTGGRVQGIDYSFKDPRMKELNEYSSQLIRELIIPKLTKEVNISKRYAALRQVFFSLVMARWFKDNFTGKPGTYASLIDSHNLNDISSQEPWSKTVYFNQYKESFAKGEYNLKEQVATPYGQTIRSYVSGGVVMNFAKNIYEGGKKLFLPVLFAGVSNLSLFAGNGDTGAMRKVGAEEYSVRQEKALTVANYLRAKKETQDNIRAFTRDLEKKFPLSPQIIRKIQEYIIGFSSKVLSLSPQDSREKRIGDILKDIREEFGQDYPITGMNESLEGILNPLDTLANENNSIELNEAIRLAIRQATLDLRSSIERSLKERTGSSPLAEKEKISRQIWLAMADLKKLLNDLDGKITPEDMKPAQVPFGPEVPTVRSPERAVNILLNLIADYLKDMNSIPSGLDTFIRIMENYRDKDLKEVLEKYKFVDKLNQIIEKLSPKQKDAVSPEVSIEATREKQAASPLAGSEPSRDTLGGIDFRAMNYLTQPMGSFQGLNFTLPLLSSSALEAIDLDEELDQITNMAMQGIIPSGQRIKEYLAACFQKGKIEDKQEYLLLCLVEVCRLLEDENMESAPELREAIVIADSGRFVLQAKENISLN